MTMVPKAITAPLDKSIPAVRITRVCPIASVPMTITCWTTSERFVPVRKRGDWIAKKALAINKAIKGPIVLRETDWVRYRRTLSLEFTLGGPSVTKLLNFEPPINKSDWYTNSTPGKVRIPPTFVIWYPSNYLNRTEHLSSRPHSRFYRQLG